MDEHTWPLNHTVAPGHVFFTKADLLEFLSDFDDDVPLWIDNYWQPVRQVTQRPLGIIANHPDGIHLG